MRCKYSYMLWLLLAVVLIQSCASTSNNPAAGNYRIDPLDKGLWRIQSINGGPGETSTIYVIEGSESALIIDAGLGKEGLKEVVDQLIGSKPFKLTLTHGHRDHTGGISYFPEVYLHRSDANITRGILIDTDEGWPAVCRQEYIEDGHVFDLGDKKIEVISVPGHSPGSVAFLNRSGRYIMTGDTINPLVWAHVSWQPLSFYFDSVKKLETLKGAVDHVYVGHHEQETRGSIMTPQSITDARILAERIIEGTIRTNAYYSQRAPSGREASYGSVRLVFDPSKLK